MREMNNQIGNCLDSVKKVKDTGKEKHKQNKIEANIINNNNDSSSSSHDRAGKIFY